MKVSQSIVGSSVQIGIDFTEEEAELLGLKCGGPGSGVPGPCPTHKEEEKPPHVSLPRGVLFDAKAGNGGQHLDHVLLKEGESGPSVKHTGPGPHDYEMRGREHREAGKVTEFRPVHPDEPHSMRDITWTTGIQKGVGGGAEDTSPKNPTGVQAKALKYWATPGTAAADHAGQSPQHSVIREAADRHFGIVGAKPNEYIKIGKLSDEDATSLAKNLINSIEKAPASQPTLWRGISDKYAKQLSSAKEGDVVVFSLGSSSRDANAAAQYAGRDGSFFRILPGSKGIAVRTYFHQDQEVITGGKFKIVGRSKSSSGQEVIDLEQTETLKWQ